MGTEIEKATFNINPLFKSFILNEIILFLLDDGNQVTILRYDLFAQEN